MDLSVAISMYIVLLLSLTVHEWAHAFVSTRLGDPTPSHAGRVTLNPIAHIDLIGTVILPLIILLFSPGFVLFGYGKPVPIDSRYFKNQKWGEIFVSLAGPFANIFFCFIASLIFQFCLLRGYGEAIPLLKRVMLVNALLAIFNLIPLPPLDGATVLRYLIRMKDETYLRISQWSFFILLIMINLPPFQVFFSFLIQVTYGSCLTLSYILLLPILS